MTKILRQYKITLERVDSNSSTTVSDPDNLGLRTKLGGKPDWIQADEAPACPSCRQKMSFVGQIDSIEHESKHNLHSISAISPEQEYMFGDVGMIYVFFCFECGETKSVYQFY
ncbi:hypothetical protein A2875_00700 [Candidatus Gottesmanbacteria bacterium RIFCSPHIGHO2_01_FULL_46_14]|uniref:DUF1963 domain-containing protein n=2 Tax=Microgenomates group TaxID=1794810 RepID=A0A1F5ZSB4_9BACT|nr:MAG: hypothetical protein UU34_C0015G0009 [Candidatus Curtissbacteria bacterium GW2011_GWA1_41_11]OGG14997.1 MAG: hypothetical protein A2875_00700 [Candidatus Gottesmanbacteria bacterium RIFCSPHIGHO2_01_FULL_46_14]